MAARAGAGRRHGRRPRRAAATGPVAPLEERTLLAGVGDLDPTFGAGGVVVANLGQPTPDVARAVAANGAGLNGGLIVVGETRTASGGQDVAVVRYRADGTLDPAFGVGGIRTIDLGGAADAAGAVALDAQGRIVVAACAGTATPDLAVIRLTPAGALDATFDGDGVRPLRLAGVREPAAALAIDAQGRIIVAGTVAGASGRSDVAAVRLLADGATDSQFGAGGTRTIDWGLAAEDNARGVSIDAQGRVVLLAGTAGAGGTRDFGLARLTADGALDATFGAGGRRTVDLGGGADEPRGVALDGRGRIVVGGTTRRPGAAAEDLAAARLTADGALDASFGAGGTRTIDLGGAELVAAVAVDAQDRVLLGGTAKGRPGTGDDLAVARLTADGAPDATFGPGGARTLAMTAADRADAGNALAIDDSGGIVLAGTTDRANVGPDFALARLTAAGATDATFGTLGRVATNLGLGGTSFENFAGLAAGADGRLVAVANWQDGAVAVVRYLPDGRPDATFGVRGVALLDFGGEPGGAAARSGSASAAGVVIDARGRIVVAGTRMESDRSLFAVARLTPDGVPDATFGAGGVRTLDFGGPSQNLHALAVDGKDRVILAGTTLQAETAGDVAAARLTADGVLDATFGAGGRYVAHLGGSQEYAYAVAVDGQDRVVLAGSTDGSVATGADMVAIRLTAAGVPDASFGIAGVRTIAVGSQDDVARAVAIDAQGRIVLAGSAVDPMTRYTDLALVRLTAAGALDPGFAAGGVFRMDLGGTMDAARAVAVDGGGRVVAVGQSNAGGAGSDLAVLRLTPAGLLDADFDGDGRRLLDLGTPRDVGNAVALSRGRVLVAGVAAPGWEPTDGVLAALIADRPPVARVTPASGRVAEGGTLALDATGSTDPDAGAALRFAWDLDGDGAFDDATGPVATLSAAALDGRAGAVVSARVRVTDEHGLEATAAAAVAVDNLAPSLAAAGPGVTVRAGDPAAHRGTWGDVPADAAGVTLAASLGTVTKAADGSWSWSLAATAGPPRTTTVTITATDDDGGTAGTSFTLTTTDSGAPTIASVAADGPAREGAAVAVAVVASHPYGDALAYAFDWDGDGTYEAAGPAARASHVFADDGIYTVNVRATDERGASAYGSVRVAVANVAPVGTLVVPAGPVPEGGVVSVRLVDVFDPGADAPRFSFALSREALAGRYADAATTPAASLAVPADGVITVWARVLDEDGGATDISRSVTVTNAAPTPAIGVATAALIEGTPIDLTGTATDPGAADVVSLSWAVTRAGAPFGPAGSGPAFRFTPDDNGDYVVTLTATDDAGGRREVSRTLAVANAAPVLLTPGVLGAAREGGTATVVAAATDPAGANDPLRYAFDWEDDGTFEPATTSYQASRLFPDDGTFTVRVRVTDDDGGVAIGTVRVVVANASPTGTLALGPDVLMEGGTLTARLGNVVEPGADGLRYSFALSREALATGYATASATNAASFRPTNNGTMTVWARVFDEDGGGSEYSRAIKVWNAPPVVAAPVVPAAATRARTAVSVSATFTDAGRSDWHDAVWEWGDGTTSAGTVAESGGSGRVTGSHAYLTPGLYRVRVTVKDRDGSVAAMTAKAITAIYDPTAGSIGGSGSLASPAGAVIASPKLTGTATFNLSARYATSTATVPTGSVTFALTPARLNFQSTRLEWLAVAGSRARLQGEGTINGAGRYGVRITVADGTRDSLRVRIWDKATGAVVYDNLPLADEISTASAPVAGGNVTFTRPPPPRATLARRLSAARR